jgi:hypothetical protein
LCIAHLLDEAIQQSKKMQAVDSPPRVGLPLRAMASRASVRPFAVTVESKVLPSVAPAGGEFDATSTVIKPIEKIDVVRSDC